MLCLAAVLGGLLCYRAGAGPFLFFFVKVNSPIALTTAAFFLWASCLILNSLRYQRRYDPSVYRWWLWSFVVASLGACVVLFASGFSDPFLSDDYILVLRAVSEEVSPVQLWYERGGDGAFRPVGGYYFFYASRMAGSSPFAWRVLSLSLHLVCAALLFLLCRRLWPWKPTIPFLACSLFLIHGTRPEVVFWTAGSFDLLACCLSLAALYWWIVTLDNAAVLHYAGTIVLLSMAILSKESAYATPPIGVALLLASESRARKSTGSFAVAGFGVAIALFAHRMILFEGPGGYIDPSTGRPLVLSLNVVSSVKALFGRIWQVLFLPVNWDAGTSWLVGVSIVVFLFAVMRTARFGRMSSSLWLISGVIAAVVPAIHLALVGENLLGSRVLYLPSTVYCIWFAHQVILDTRVSRLLVCGILLTQTVFLWHNLTAWRQAAALAESICSEPNLPRREVLSIPTVYRGAYVFSNGYEDCLKLKNLKNAGSTFR